MNHPKPLSAQITPRFAGPTTFYRLPGTSEIGSLDVPIVGVPYDSGASFRVGARFGPRSIREASSLLRPYNRILGIDPYEAVRIDDTGDLTVSPYDPMGSLTTIDEHFRPIFAAGQFPLSFGGDHSITLPILRAAAATHGPIAMIQFDSHLDTWSTYFGSRYTHGSFAIRAIEEGLIDPGGINPGWYSRNALRRRGYRAVPGLGFAGDSGRRVGGDDLSAGGRNRAQASWRSPDLCDLRYRWGRSSVCAWYRHP